MSKTLKRRPELVYCSVCKCRPTQPRDLCHGCDQEICSSCQESEHKCQKPETPDDIMNEKNANNEKNADNENKSAGNATDVATLSLKELGINSPRKSVEIAELEQYKEKCKTLEQKNSELQNQIEDLKKNFESLEKEYAGRINQIASVTQQIVNSPRGEQIFDLDNDDDVKALKAITIADKIHDEKKKSLTKTKNAVTKDLKK
jgi:FtsZ-binding cell division protein ZapB